MCKITKIEIQKKMTAKLFVNGEECKNDQKVHTTNYLFSTIIR